MITSHLLQRLESRGIHADPHALDRLAESCNQDTAILLYRLESHKGDNNPDYYSRSESNGNLVYMIVRGKKCVTIMYRRDNQNNTTRGLRVNRLLDISTL